MSVRVRDFSREDAQFLGHLARDPRVVRFVGDGTVWSDAYIAERTAQALSPGAWGELGSARWVTVRCDDVEGESDDHRIGLALAMFKDLGGDIGPCTEIGYWLDPEFWGRGLAKQMVVAVVAWVEAGMAGKEPTKLVARIAPDNAASAATVLNLGFERTGVSEGMDVYTLLV
ncbi:hypothetical protein BJH93_06730 [Kocuria polaris]|nr:hypothetical protein [Kocuria polaris]